MAYGRASLVTRGHRYTAAILLLQRPFCELGCPLSILPGCYLRGCKNISLGSNIGLGLFAQIYATGTGSEKITIGDDVSLNSNVMLNADMGGVISIGKDCLIGPNVVFRTSSHIFSSKLMPIRDQGHKPGRILVGSGVWIGANSCIIGSVTIGDGAVVGAGAVVISDVDDYTIVGGSPARLLRARN